MVAKPWQRSRASSILRFLSIASYGVLNNFYKYFLRCVAGSAPAPTSTVPGAPTSGAFEESSTSSTATSWSGPAEGYHPTRASLAHCARLARQLDQIEQELTENNIYDIAAQRIYVAVDNWKRFYKKVRRLSIIRRRWSLTGRWLKEIKDRGRS